MTETRQTPGTNIKHEHKAAFEALSSGDYSNFALFSCFVGGEPAAAIVAVNRDGEEYNVAPLFVSVTPGMVLTDHDGRAPDGAKAAKKEALAEARAETEESIAKGEDRGRDNSR